MPRWLAKHYFCVGLWGCFQKKLAFELVDWVKKITLISVGGHHPIHWGAWPEQKAKEGRENLPFMLRHPSFPVLRLLWSWVWGHSDSMLNYTICFPASLTCRLQIMGLFGLFNCICQFLKEISFYIYLYILLVLFFWRILTNTLLYSKVKS